MRDNLRAAMGRFATGVAIITTKKEGEINGMTANSLTSVSLNPPMVLICIDRDNYSHKLIAESKVFAINFLGAGQQELSDAFARPGSGKAEYLARLETTSAATGSPIISGSLAYIDCRVAAIHAAGDHSIFVGEVAAAEVMVDQDPLLYWNGGYREIGKGEK